jgi:signal transduction histidine kinase
VRRQPAWSDFPIVVLTEEGASSEMALRTLETLGNVTLLERPVRVPALVSAVRSALRARRRQHQIRDYLAESERTAASLREADRRKDEFLAILAHELRNPLAPLRNALEAMRYSPQDVEALAWARSIMERQLAQMVRLIDDLLDVSRVSRGRVDLKLENASLSVLVQGAIELCQQAIEHARHSLSVCLPSEPVYLRCDPTRIVQVLGNLLSNATKYTPPGGHLEITARVVDGEVEVVMRDDGIGIPPDMLTRVFDMFTQVERSLERAQGGLGIGLTLVKRLVEMHGGRVEAQSEGPGRGSTFVLRLPQHVLETKTDAVAILPVKLGGERRRILIADDNRDAADSLAFVLRRVGHEVRTAYDGEEALDMASSFRPELALLDIGMPRLNGYDTAQRIRKETYGREMLIVALTGWGQHDDVRKSELAGFDHHLVKPVDPAVLGRLLEKNGPAIGG